MALAKERMRHDRRSSFDPSLEFLGSDQGHFPTYLDLSNSSNIRFLSSLQHENEQSINANHLTYPSSSSSSLLRFDQKDRSANSNYSNLDLEHEECADVWIDNMGSDTNCFKMANGYGEGASQKRAYMGSDMPASKKHCGTDRKVKAKPSSSKEPHSIAAKNRRERISERLKILQHLVPNGTKVDLVTMLEKAISYVKFLQLQVKVLATDAFWPAQGGKAPEASQVKEAIDAILTSHRDKKSSISKN